MKNLVSADLSVDDRQLLSTGLREWGGPGRPSDDVVRAMGFRDLATLLTDAKRIADLLDQGAELSNADWGRALVATEFAFASDYYGSGVDWATTTGYDDATTIRRLRDLQRELVGIAKLP